MTDRPARILVVDDEPDVELLVRQRFRRPSGEFAFSFARNGEEALRRLQEDPEIDVVVTDINMPVMDGLALLAQLDGDAIRKAVILSAYGDMPNIRAAMNRGAFDFLTKPIDFQDFEATLRKTLQAVREARQGLQAQEQLYALRQELEIAARIQHSILPRSFPAFPERGEFDLDAEMIPARQVGGDFYDFFFIDDDRLGFVIGDVSGKGVPAALFMAVSRTLLRATALQGVSPAECLAYMNHALHRQSAGDGVYVTLFYGVLDAATGEMEFAIGGHPPPFVVSPEGDLRELCEPAGLVVGLLGGAAYQNGRTRLEPGDSILLYTDGVTEALDPGGRFFSEKRLRALLRSMTPKAPQPVIHAVLEEVAAFTAGAPQSDDITLLALQYLGRSSERSGG